MTDTEMLDWLIENEAFVVARVMSYLVMRHVTDTEFETLAKGETAREAITKAAKGEQQ